MRKSDVKSNKLNKSCYKSKEKYKNLTDKSKDLREKYKNLMNKSMNWRHTFKTFSWKFAHFKSRSTNCKYFSTKCNNKNWTLKQKSEAQRHLSDWRKTTRNFVSKKSEKPSKIFKAYNKNTKKHRMKGIKLLDNANTWKHNWRQCRTKNVP